MGVMRSTSVQAVLFFDYNSSVSDKASVELNY